MIELELHQPRMLFCHCLPPGSLHVLGAFGHFHRAISHLKWYEIVCMRYLACTFSQMKSINMFSMLLQSGIPRHFLGNLLRFECITSLFSCLCISMLTSNSSGNMQKRGYLGCFHAASARENTSWVWVIDIPTFCQRGVTFVVRFPQSRYQFLWLIPVTRYAV